MSAVDLSSYFGLAAMLLLTCNILLGLLISTRYSPVKRWPHRRINIFALHNWTGYVALSVAAIHPLILLFSRTAGIKLTTILWPVNSPSQPAFMLLGALAFYCLTIVVGTSYFRVQLGRRIWKAIHYTAYASAALFYIHGIRMDPELKSRPTDYLDGEKVLVEGCMLLVIAAIGWRIHYARNKQKGPRVVTQRIEVRQPRDHRSAEPQ
jgi:predicted ferric reductase